MCAEHERPICRSALKPIFVCDIRSRLRGLPLHSPLPLKRFLETWNVRSPLHSRSPDFCPLRSVFRSAHMLWKWQWCKSEVQDVQSSSRTTTTRISTRIFFIGRTPFLSPNNSVKSLKGKSNTILATNHFVHAHCTQ